MQVNIRLRPVHSVALLTCGLPSSHRRRDPAVFSSHGRIDDGVYDNVKEQMGWVSKMTARPYLRLVRFSARTATLPHYQRRSAF